MIYTIFPNQGNNIVASKSTHTREVAKKTPAGAEVTSREKQLSRYVRSLIGQLPNMCNKTACPVALAAR